jgi:tRNA pseudouridine38-40 synthase
MRYVLKIAYDGSRYAGWQRQKNALSVQQVLEESVFTALGANGKITASGRTDAGVHAAGQVCHFDSDSLSIPPERLPDCLNRILPDDIRAIAGTEGKNGFDSNRSAKRKTYAYRLYVSEREMPLKERYAVRIDRAAELMVLQETAKLFEGEHDFKAFCASGSSVKTTVRTVYEVRVEETYSFGSRDLTVYVTGNGFLYNMVRTLTGELLELSSGKRSKESLQKAYETGDRSLLGKTMPAKGLTLMEVDYGELLSF